MPVRLAVRGPDIAVFVGKVIATLAGCWLLAPAARITDLTTLLFVTLLCLYPTVLGGIRLGLQQFIAATAGSLGTVALLALTGNWLLAVAVALPVAAAVLSYREQAHLLPIAFFSVLYQGILGREAPALFLYERFAHFVVGIPLATLINYAAGAYNYRQRLFAGIRQVRRAVFAQAAGLLAAAASQEIASNERELARVDVLYRRLGEIVSCIRDIEGEYASPLGRLRRARIARLTDYRLYVWHLHDLLQQSHAMAALQFNVPLPESCRAQLRELADRLQRAATGHDVGQAEDQPGAAITAPAAATPEQGDDQPATAPTMPAAATPEQAAAYGIIAAITMVLTVIRREETRLTALDNQSAAAER